MKRLALLGFPLSHSFSRSYFERKFKNENINSYEYSNAELDSIDKLPFLLEKEGLIGFNVTIPYKEKIIPYLDQLDNSAKEVGAVNTVKLIRTENRIRLVGYNTDIYGFEKSLGEELNKHKNALILGTGGAAKAVAFVLSKAGINAQFVSRNSDNLLNYNSLDKIIKTHTLIINTTPLGMYPDINSFPLINYDDLTTSHFLYDLVYNPEETLFLKKARLRGAKIKNGLQMLELQAEKAWSIFTKYKIGQFMFKN